MLQIEWDGPNDRWAFFWMDDGADLLPRLCVIFPEGGRWEESFVFVTRQKVEAGDGVRLVRIGPLVDPTTGVRYKLVALEDVVRDKKAVNLKLKSLIQVALQRGLTPRDAMDHVQANTHKEYRRDDLRDAADAAIETITEEEQA